MTEGLALVALAVGIVGVFCLIASPFIGSMSTEEDDYHSRTADWMLTIAVPCIAVFTLWVLWNLPR